MADYHTMELNEAHRWLPTEILQDIGIVQADEHDLTIIEELASRLVRVLNSTMERYQCHHHYHARENKTYRQQCPPQPQAYRLDRWVHFANSNANAQTTKTWPLLGNGRIMDGTINQPRFALQKQQLVGTVLSSAKPISRGTGVFLPRTGAYNQMTGRDRTPRISSVDLNPRYIRQQCQQKEQQQLHIRSHALVIAQEKQERRMKEANAASHDCPDEFGLPREWIY